MGNKRRKGSGDSYDERASLVMASLREALMQAATITRKPAKRGINIDDRITSGTASTRYNVGAISAAIDFKRLCRDMLMMADHLFKEVFLGVYKLEFTQGSTVEDAVNEYVAESVKWVDGFATKALADYYAEVVIAGATFAGESFLTEVMRQEGLKVTKTQLKPIRDAARRHASALLATRIPGVGRGGARDAIKSGPTDDALIAFYGTVKRVAPFWEDAKRRKDRGDDAWRSVAKSLPEYRQFTDAEKEHAEGVLNQLHGGVVNGSRFPRAFAREHARLILTMDQVSDPVLRRHEGQGKRLAATRTA